MQGVIKHCIDKEYRWSPSQYVLADFAYDAYANQWLSMRVTISGNNIYYFVNGDLVGSGPFTKPTADRFYIKSSGTLYLDELRVTTGGLSSTSVYDPPSAPYDTNKVLALPDDLIANTIYVMHSTPVTTHRIGGVRPSNPVTGFFYIPLHDDYTGGQPQLYDGSNWVNVTATVYDGATTKSALGYVFSPIGASPDVDADAKPERPPDPVDPAECTHEWEEDTDQPSTPPSCSLEGSAPYICHICGSTKTETIPILPHTWTENLAKEPILPTCSHAGTAYYVCSECGEEKTEPLSQFASHLWEVKSSVQTSYGEDGELITQGYTIYKCKNCGEEYKGTEGTGPPGPSSTTTPDGSTDTGENWFTSLLKGIAGFIGGTVGALLELIGSILTGILDGLMTLVEDVIGKLASVVDLFGAFGDALGVLWSWLPPEMVTIIVAAVGVFVIVGLLKLFL